MFAPGGASSAPSSGLSLLVFACGLRRRLVLQLSPENDRTYHSEPFERHIYTPAVHYIRTRGAPKATGFVARGTQYDPREGLHVTRSIGVVSIVRRTARGPLMYWSMGYLYTL